MSNNNLLQQAQAVFAKEFLSFDTTPDGWKESSLLGIADYLNGLAMQKFRPKDGENGLPVLKIKELRQGSCDASSELCSPSIKKEYMMCLSFTFFTSVLFTNRADHSALRYLCSAADTVFAHLASPLSFGARGLPSLS